jgi:hypothetical protein
MDDSGGGYRYDVFLSYSRSGHWETFVDEVFEPMLTHWLGEELGRTPAIFKDRARLSIGQSWPDTLESALRSSRVMITLWSRQYFASEWCRHELSFMLARASLFKRRGVSDRIILPTIVHDGKRFPTFLSVLQGLNLSEYADPFMTVQSTLRDRLSAKIQELSRDAASAIESVPDESHMWDVCDASYMALFSEFEVRQSTPPSLGGVA